jgi:hypothetical protein
MEKKGDKRDIKKRTTPSKEKTKDQKFQNCCNECGRKKINENEKKNQTPILS